MNGTFVLVAIGLAILAYHIAKQPIAPIPSTPGTHPDYAGGVVIDSGLGYSYSINPTQNPNAFDSGGNVVGLPSGAHVVGPKL